MGWNRNQWESLPDDEREEQLAYDYYLMSETATMRREFEHHELLTPETLAAFRLAGLR